MADAPATRVVTINGVKLTEYALPCPECGEPLVLRPSRHGLFYGCSTYPKCLSAHGAHPSGAPLGIPATKEVKAARIRAHDAFDTLWKTGNMARHEAYRWMRTALVMTKEEAHIGNFDIPACDRLIQAVTQYMKLTTPE